MRVGTLVWRACRDGAEFAETEAKDDAHDTRQNKDAAIQYSARFHVIVESWKDVKIIENSGKGATEMAACRKGRGPARNMVLQMCEMCNDEQA